MQEAQCHQPPPGGRLVSHGMVPYWGHLVVTCRGVNSMLLSQYINTIPATFPFVSRSVMVRESLIIKNLCNGCPCREHSHETDILTLWANSVSFSNQLVLSFSLVTSNVLATNLRYHPQIRRRPQFTSSLLLAKENNMTVYCLKFYALGGFPISTVRQHTTA